MTTPLTSPLAGRHALVTGSTSGIGAATARALAADGAGTVTDTLEGRVDIVVHNAALCPAVDTPGLSDTDLEATLAVNIRAPHVLTAELAPVMADRGTGAIIVVGSWMAVVGSPIVGLYSATKAAATQLARSWAAEFGPRGVRVNTIAPGVTRTPINNSSGDLLDQITAPTPAGRPVTPEDVAAAIVWTASDQAAFIHGATIPVDGGITSTRQ